MKLFLLCSILFVFLQVATSDYACQFNAGCRSCGNGKCEIGETTCSCPQDCPGCCEDGSCRADRGETHINCPKDCGVDILVNVVDEFNWKLIPKSVVSCVNQMEVLGPVVTPAGSTVFKDQATSTWTCRGDAEGYIPNFASGFFSTPPRCIDQRNITIPLRYKYGCIFGEVRDALSGKPIPGAKVHCESADNAFSPKISDANGQFWEYRVTKGVWTCSATAPGYLAGLSTGPFSYEDKKSLVIELNPVPGTLNGFLIDSKNKTALIGAVTCTDVNGRTYHLEDVSEFSFKNLPPGPASCFVFKELYAPISLGGIVPSGGVLNLNFPLVEWYGNLNGTVIDGRTGRPISSAHVMCESMFDEGGDLTSITGTYFVGGLKHAPFDCMVTHCGYMDGWKTQIVVVNQTRTLDFVLLPLEITIKGRIYNFVSNPGAYIAGATITCVATDGVDTQTVTTKSDALGYYRVGEIYGFGEVTCTASAEGYQTSQRTCPFSYESKLELDITLPKVGLNPK